MISKQRMIQLFFLCLCALCVAAIGTIVYQEFIVGSSV